MRLNRKALLEELKFVAAAAERGSSIPILTHTLWRVGASGRLELRATDAETTLESSVEVGDAEEGELAVPAAASIALLSDMFDEEVEIELTEKGWRATDGRSKVRLDALPGAEFPEQPPMEGEAQEVSVGRTRAALAAVRHAGQQSSQYKAQPTGFALILAEPVTMAATDGHRLAISGSLEALTPSDGALLRLPGEAARFLEGLGGEDKDTWSFKTDEHRISVGSGDGRQLSFRRPEGTFPDVGALLKRIDPPHAVTADRAELLAAARAATACPGILDRTVVVNIGGESGVGIELLARGNYSEVRVRVAAKVDGAPLRIGVNGPYLVDLLESVVGKDFRLQYQDPGNPFYYESAPDDNGVTEWRVVAQKVLPA